MTTSGDQKPKTNDTPTKPQANTNKQKSGNGLLGAFVFLIFLLAIGGLGAGYYVWQELQKDLQAAEVERTALKHALGTLDENPRFQKFSHSFNKKIEKANSNIKKLGDDVNTLSNKQKQIATVVEDTSDVINRGQRDWMLQEVDHVLRMAQHRLLLDRDFEGAMVGLRAADARIKDMNDVRLIPVRQSIAKQTQTLNQYPHPDYTGIQLELDNTIAKLKDGLVKKAQHTAREEKPEVVEQAENKAPESSKPFDYKELLARSQVFISESFDKAKATLSDSVNVTHGEQKIALFIEEQEKKRAYDFLRNKLLGAKYSVSTRDDLAFHQELNAARAWLENNDEFTNREALIKQIDTLNKNNLMPPLPDISQPSILLTKFMDSLEDKK